MKIRYGKQNYELEIVVDGEGRQSHEIEVNDEVKYIVDIKYGPVRTGKPYKQEAWLAKQYLKRGRTMADIARECGVSPMTIYLWLDKFGIDTRNRGRPPLE